MYYEKVGSNTQKKGETKMKNEKLTDLQKENIMIGNILGLVCGSVIIFIFGIAYLLG